MAPNTPEDALLRRVTILGSGEIVDSGIFIVIY